METKMIETAIPASITDIWQRIVNSISKMLHVPSVMINRLAPPELEVFRSNIAASNPFPSGTRMPMQGIYCESTARLRRKVQVVDARKDPEWADSPTAKAGVFAYLGFPLFWPDGEVFGTICTIDTKENNWGEKCDNILLAFKEAIEAHLTLARNIENLQKKNLELEQALSEIKTLQGLLPICSSCKKVRDDDGYWRQIEDYFKKRSEIEFSHGICPECAKKYYPEYKLYDPK